MQIRLFNSLTKKIETFHPCDENSVRMYSCGPTVYNYAHIGNMRAFLFADFLQRVFRTVGGYKVKWVMNITDVDDKTIKGSAVGGDDWKPEMGEQTDDPKINLKKYTDYFLSEFIKDIESLGIRSKDFFDTPKATEYITPMQNLIRRIVNNGFGYVSNGSVYFNLAEWRKVDLYGKLFKVDFDNFRDGVRIDSDQYEREQVSDFVLWKAKKEGEPYWDFQLNGLDCSGRPGWHIECSSMEFELLGLPFDVHTGGVDLKFPHHEDEIAQSKAGYGVDPTIFWCHNEFLEVEGEKMSKSLGNFYTLRDLTDKGIDPLDIRYLMLSAHYASSLNFTFEGVKAARKARKRLQDYISKLISAENEDGEKIKAYDLRKRVFAELAEDLHSPKALAELFTFIHENPPENIEAGCRKQLINFFKALNEVFGVWELKPAKMEIPEDILAMAQRRFEAKKNRNFDEADRLREEISQKGYTVRDKKDGFDVVQND